MDEHTKLLREIRDAIRANHALLHGQQEQDQAFRDQVLRVTVAG